MQYNYDPAHVGCDPSDFKGQSAPAPFKDLAEVWQRFGSPDGLWLAMLAAGCQFQLVPGERWRRWQCIPPSRPLPGDDAIAVAWGLQLLKLDPAERPSFCVSDALLAASWSIEYAAERLGKTPKATWALIRDGGLGAFELRYGRWQVSPASVERYLQRAKPGDAKPYPAGRPDAKPEAHLDRGRQ